MGGSLNTGTGTDSTNITGEVLSEFDVRFVELLADVILNPNFQQKDLDLLKANKLRALTVARQQAANQAWEKFRETRFSLIIRTRRSIHAMKRSRDIRWLTSRTFTRSLWSGEDASLRGRQIRSGGGKDRDS
jgi:hypothetical protein